MTNLNPQQFPEKSTPGRKNTQFWKEHISNLGEGMHNVPATVAARKAIKQTMDEQGYAPDAPLRGVIQETPGGRNMINVSGGRINAGINYDVDRFFDEKPINIHQVRVDRSAQGQGIGSQMMQEIAKSHPESTEMKVFGALASAKPWYEKLGATFAPESSLGQWNIDRLNNLRGL